MPIHASAQIDRQAEIDPAADIGPNVVVDGPVRIGAGTKVYPNAYISGWTTIGANCQIHPGAIVGHLPQDFHFSGERTFCEVGDGTIIREFASVHRGTQPESKTIVGNNCFLMAYSHVGHNCDIRDGAKIYNCAALSGHVEVGANAIVSGYSLLHQFIRVGELAMIGGGSRIGMDVLPFMMVMGESECIGINAIGMRRAGYSAEERTAVKEAYRTLYRSPQTFRKACETLRGQAQTACTKRIVEFVSVASKRGFCGPPGHQRGGSPSTRAGKEAEGIDATD